MTKRILLNVEQLDYLMSLVEADMKSPVSAADFLLKKTQDDLLGKLGEAYNLDEDGNERS